MTTNKKSPRPPAEAQINHIEHLKKSLVGAADNFVAGLHAMEAEAQDKEAALAELDRKIREAEAKFADLL
jgi:hypothetical protein